MKRIFVVSSCVVLCGVSVFGYLAPRANATDESQWFKYTQCSDQHKPKSKFTPYEPFQICSDELQAAFVSGSANARALVSMLSIEDKLTAYSRKYKVTIAIDQAIANTVLSAENGVRVTGSTGMLASYYSYMTNVKSYSKEQDHKGFESAIYNGAKWSYVTVALTPSQFQNNPLPKVSSYFLANSAQRFHMNQQEILIARDGIEAGRAWIKKICS
ncbi:hypothetical protein [Pseudomonas sp. SCB32]|uniref:hypothetical protein n=1 Tax=Pseudomonas sp. SCB32 TaxID=2653853 RepID=UPI00126414A5|nr:hypothetical protein [Pseudomonas sp. SCB32]